MNSIATTENQILLSRKGELVRISACGENAIRFQGFPDCKVVEENYTFGERNFEILKKLIFLREKLRPYIKKQMNIASEKGYPVIRPMFFHYPDDKWVLTKNSKIYTKGWHTINAELHKFIAFVKAGADVLECFD